MYEQHIIEHLTQSNLRFVTNYYFISMHENENAFLIQYKQANIYI